MKFPRQQYWSRLPFPSLWDLSNSGIKPSSPALVGGFFPTEPPGKPGWLGVKNKSERRGWGCGGCVWGGERGQKATEAKVTFWQRTQAYKLYSCWRLISNIFKHLDNENRGNILLLLLSCLNHIEPFHDDKHMGSRKTDQLWVSWKLIIIPDSIELATEGYVPCSFPISSVWWSLCFRAGEKLRKDILDVRDRKLDWESSLLDFQSATD